MWRYAHRMNQPRVAVIAALLLGVGLLSGCGGATSPAVTTDPPRASTTPSPEPTSEAERGTRENPLAVGEYRKITDDSVWTVGAEGPTVTNDGYVLLPLRLEIDWDLAEQKAEASGDSIERGTDPWQVLRVEFVTSDGRSYRTMDDHEVEVPNSITSVGTVYPPAGPISANVAISVPNEQVDGGTWVVRNSADDVVFIASK